MSRRLARLVALAILAAGALPGHAPTAGHAAPAATVIVEPDAGIGPLLDLIGRARHSFAAEVAAIPSRRVLGALMGAAGRHVRVRIILDAHQPSAADVVNTLLAHGVAVRLYTRGALLGGFAVSDDTRLWIGSMDWSDSAFTRNRELAVVMANTATARQAGALFAADWQGRAPRRAPPGLVVSPLNARAAITRLIESAHRSLDLYARTFSDARLAALLAARRRHGVQVRVVTSQAAGMPRLRAAGVQVTVAGGLFIHADSIVVDRATVFIGAQTFNGAALDDDRALGVILRDQQVAAAVERAMAADQPRAAVRPATATSTRTFLPTDTPTPPPASPTPTATATVPAATATTAPTPLGFYALASVNPNPIENGAEATLIAHSLPGATCAASAVYGTGQTIPAFQGQPQMVPSTNAVLWMWTVNTVLVNGLATVVCTLDGATATNIAMFTVLH